MADFFLNFLYFILWTDIIDAFYFQLYTNLVAKSI